MPAAKLPVADFRTQADWHAYLGKLTATQLKKVATALNKILRTEFRLNTKKPAAELIEDVKKLYSVNNNTKLLEIVKQISADELPQPSQNLPKPTKKQAAAAKEAEKSRVRKVIEERVSKAKEEAKQAEIKKKAQEAQEAAEMAYIKRIQERNRQAEIKKKKVEIPKEIKSKNLKERAEDDKKLLINNWGDNNYDLMDIYMYNDYLNVENLQRYVDGIKKKNYSFAINFMASKLPIDIIEEVYNKYGLKTLLIGLTNIAANLFEKDYPMFWDDKALPKQKMNKEFRKFYKNEEIKTGTIAYNQKSLASELKGYDNIIRTINKELK